MSPTTIRKRPMTFADLMAVERISQVATAPDGLSALYVTSKPDPGKNATKSTIRRLDLATGESVELTPGPGNHRSPAWSPDGKWIAFASDREKEEGPQVWVMPAGGGEARRVTSGYGGASGLLWAPDSRRIAFTRSVVVSEHVEKAKGETPKKAPEKAKVHGLVNEKSSARVADGLLFRHWDEWRDRKRNHIHLVDAESGETGDITPHDCDAPPISLGSERDYDFHPKGNEIAFVMNPDEVVARSTNNSIFIQRIRGVRMNGVAECISVTDACDCHPRYSGDGGRIFYLGMEKPRYEADKNRIKAYERSTGETKVYLERFDRSPHAFEPHGAREVLFLAADRGRQSIYALDAATGRVRQETAGAYYGLFKTIPGSNDLLVTRESTTEPADLHLLARGEGMKPHVKNGPWPKGIPPADGTKTKRLTRHGEAVSRVEWNDAEEFWYEGAAGAAVHGFLIRPPRFRKGGKYPMILLIHGGPQGAFSDHFHYRWNSQMFAAEGAVVVFLNPRGSTGYGQKFTDQISGDWGGKCYEDLMKGVAAILRRFPFVDGKRIAAAGASFGGFMVNWIEGRSDRFKALVCHDGIFNAETMAYTTEELWFDEHEHGGLPHENRRPFIKWSPHRHVENFKTPMLVIHGERDFRCPISEGLGMFTALQVMGVPSRFLHFPDEGHWVMQPANAEVWYAEVIGWMMKYLKG